MTQNPQSQLKLLVAKGKEQGYLTYAEVNDHLPEDIVDSDQVEDIIQMILDGEHDDFGAEKLKGLMKILPEMDEIEMLKSFDGDKSKLGNAEKFILQLVDVPK